MAHRNTSTLVDLIERGRIDMSELTRKERKAVEKSMSVTKEQREYQRQKTIANNEYMEIELPMPKNKVKAEKVGLDWSFTQQGFKHFIPEIEETFFGKTKEFDGYIIYKANDNEAVLFEQ